MKGLIDLLTSTPKGNEIHLLYLSHLINISKLNSPPSLPSSFLSSFLPIITQLLVPKREYISEGNMIVVEKMIGINTDKQRYYFLFSDLFILTNEESKQVISTSPYSFYRFWYLVGVLV